MAAKSAGPRRHVALVRAVNVGGTSKLPMAKLRELAGSLGLLEVKTLLASGNLLFTASGAEPAALEQKLEARFLRELGMKNEFFVRDALAWQAAIDANPFPEEAARDPARLVMIALKTAPDAAALDSLRAAIADRETVELRGRELYAVYPDGIADTRLTTALIERKLGTRGTGRNWNTVLKLAAALQPA